MNVFVFFYLAKTTDLYSFDITLDVTDFYFFLYRENKKKLMALEKQYTKILNCKSQLAEIFHGVP